MKSLVTVLTLVLATLAGPVPAGGLAAAGKAG
jgi:hypothetical protein